MRGRIDGYRPAPQPGMVMTDQAAAAVKRTVRVLEIPGFRSSMALHAFQPERLRVKLHKPPD